MCIRDRLLAICAETGLSISQVMLDNELSWRTEAEVRSELLHIWSVMRECIDNGMRTEGVLPGGLKVRRRAPQLHQRLRTEGRSDDPLRGMDWLCLYALAVNEENAAGGRVVTAPTNGAAGIIPAVMLYYMRFVLPEGATQQERDDKVVEFLLTAAAIGILYKRNASISGAEVGCQGEVGSACSMAAGALCAVLGGTVDQVENAAEIGIEHNLGLTCDPVGGLVQVPCIERNAIASVKAINAARLALLGDGSHRVTLDQAAHGVARQPEVVLDPDLGRVLHLVHGATEHGAQRARRHGAGRADLALAADLGAGDGGVALVHLSLIHI